MRVFPVLKTYLGNIPYSPKSLELELKEALDKFSCIIVNSNNFDCNESDRHINSSNGHHFVRQIDIGELMQRDFQNFTLSDMCTSINDTMRDSSDISNNSHVHISSETGFSDGPESFEQFFSIRPVGWNKPILTTSWTDLQFESSAGRKTVSTKSILERIVLELTNHRKQQIRNLSCTSNVVEKIFTSCFVSPSTEIPFYANYKQVTKAYEKSLRWFKETMQYINAQKSVYPQLEYAVFGVAFPSRYPLNRASRHIALDECFEIKNNEISSKHITEKVDVNLTFHNSDAIEDVNARSKNDDLDCLAELRKRFYDSAKMLIELGAQGIVVGGAGMGESETELVSAIRGVRDAATAESKTNQEEQSDSTSNRSNKNPSESYNDTRRSIPIAVQGMDSLRQILICIQEQCTYISSNLPSLLCDMHMCIYWNIDNISDLQRCSPVDIKNSTTSLNLIMNCLQSGICRKNEVNKDNDEKDISSICQPKAKKQKLQKHDIKENSRDHIQYDSNTENDNDLINRSMAISMSKYCIFILDDKFSRDPIPLLEGCECHACKNHSRAYIHHLLKAREILGQSLLYQHNIYQFVRLFLVADYYSSGRGASESSVTSYRDYSQSARNSNLDEWMKLMLRNFT